MRKFVFALSLVVIVMSSGCKKSKDTVVDDTILSDTINYTSVPTATVTPMVTPSTTLTPTADPNKEGMAKSKLTGLYVNEEIVNNRPIAVMLNNIVTANPQSGVQDAAILYEALVEGGITRLMGIYENIDEDSKTAQRLGSIRSARHYYVSIADEYDAIFLHYGQTTYADKKINALGIDTINGMKGVGTNSFYRDKTIKAPHNAFTSLDGIQKAIQSGNYRTTYEEGYESHFQFNEEDTMLNSDVVANTIKIKFSNQITPVFTYDKEKGVYFRQQFNGPHIDYNTKEQLSFKNVLIQLVKEWDIDKNGYQTMDLEDASGKGYYITNGKVIEISWKKNEKSQKMRYYSISGEELMINAGKTYIAVFPDHREKYITIE